MKILIINNLYFPFNRGGAERIARITAEGLQKKGHNVKIVTTKPYFRGKKCESIGFIEVIRLNSMYYDLGKFPIFFRVFWQFANLFSLNKYFRLRALLKKESPDIIFSNNMMGLGYLTWLAIKQSGIKNIHILHDIALLHPSGLIFKNKEFIIDSYFARFYQFFTKILSAYPAIVISPSKWLLNAYTSRGFFSSSNNLVLLNPTENSSNTRSIPHNKTTTNKFLFIGQFEWHKGIWDVIKAFDIVNLKYPELSLDLIGYGSLEDDIRNCPKNNNIKIHPKMNHTEAMVLLSQSDCLIVPSLCYENSPTVIYEAYSLEIPVIASRIGGISELISDKALLFDPGDIDSIATTIEYCVLNSKSLTASAQNGKKNIDLTKVDYYINNIFKIL